MDDKEIMQQYYRSEIEKIKTIAPPAVVSERDQAGFERLKRFSLENVFGCLVTAGYLFTLIMPERWFSLGKLIFSFRPGF